MARCQRWSELEGHTGLHLILRPKPAPGKHSYGGSRPFVAQPVGFFRVPILGAVSSKPPQHRPNEPEIENRQARHDYAIDETLECGMELRGTEVKSVRAGKVSLAEGYVSAKGEPPELLLHSVHIAEYPPAGKAVQHEPVRVRKLLAHKKEIRKLADQMQKKGLTLVPLKIYFKNGRAKLLIGLGTGRKSVDKRQAIAKREMQRDIERAMSRRK